MEQWSEIISNLWITKLSLVALGIFLAFTVILLIAPFFKESLQNEPGNPKKFALFTVVEPSRAKLKMRGGRYIGTIRGSREKEDGSRERVENAPKLRESANVIWWLYQFYVYHFFGMHMIGIPPIQYIHTYNLPRYRVTEVDGKKIFTAVSPDDPGFRTDHVRNDLTTWYFQFAGAEIGTVGFTVQGSVQIRINSGRELEALFETDAWNVLLDQALNSVIRSVVRSSVTIDQVIGMVSKHIWNEGPDHGKEIYDEVQKKIFTALLAYKIKGQTLEQLIGLEIMKVDIIDFIPELTPQELADLRSPALKRQIARGRALEGQGESEYLKEIDKFKDLSVETIRADAMKKSAASGQIDALAAALLKKLMGV